ncbi:hypothetical protein HUU53_03800 [Candidatus Micrarchaeota archaeon]|nr:hypothetical protein [Candidatus Micrarchaeota archaeon]
MSFFVSSSRKPSVPTRQLCKWLERLFGGEYENRGKRSVEDVVQRAEEKGFTKVLFVYESHGNPSELVFLDEGEWVEPIRIKSVVFHESNARVKKVGSAESSNDAKKLMALFGEFDSSGSKAFFSLEKIYFEQDGKKIGPELVLK